MRASSAPHPILSAEALDAIYAHARRDYPNECCGIAYGPRDRPVADRATACENIQDRLHAEDPARYMRDARRAYSLGPRDIVALERSLRGETPAKIVYHSHADVGAYFSAADREAATFDVEPAYPIEYLVVDVRADGPRGARQFAWDAGQRSYVEVAAYACTNGSPPHSRQASRAVGKKQDPRRGWTSLEHNFDGGEATMGCSCSDHNHEHARKVQELLGSVGLSEVVEQGREAIAEAGRALDQLNRSERAKSLGFGAEVAAVHRDAAKRSNQRAREQVQAVLARIDDRLKQKDWKGHVDSVRAAFKERGGTAKLADLRADIRLGLLNDDSGLSATVAELALGALDSAIKAASKGDLNEVVGHLRGIMDYALQGFESPDMGRQPVGLGLPDGPKGKTKRPIAGGQNVKGWCVALYACLAWAYTSLVASLIVCFALPFCWCCFHLAALGTFAVHQILCIAAFSSACLAQGGP